MTAKQGPGLSTGLGVAFLLVAMFFVRRSFYGMRIQTGKAEGSPAARLESSAVR